MYQTIREVNSRKTDMPPIMSFVESLNRDKPYFAYNLEPSSSFYLSQKTNIKEYYKLSDLLDKSGALVLISASSLNTLRSQDIQFSVIRSSEGICLISLTWFSIGSLHATECGSYEIDRNRPIISEFVYENLSQDRFRSILMEARLTKPRKFAAWYSHRVRSRLCHPSHAKNLRIRFWICWEFSEEISVSTGRDIYRPLLNDVWWQKVLIYGRKEHDTRLTCSERNPAVKKSWQNMRK